MIRHRRAHHTASTDDHAGMSGQGRWRRVRAQEPHWPLSAQTSGSGSGVAEPSGQKNRGQSPDAPRTAAHGSAASTHTHTLKHNTLLFLFLTPQPTLIFSDIIDLTPLTISDQNKTWTKSTWITTRLSSEELLMATSSVSHIWWSLSTDSVTVPFIPVQLLWNNQHVWLLSWWNPSSNIMVQKILSN